MNVMENREPHITVEAKDKKWLSIRYSDENGSPIPMTKETFVRLNELVMSFTDKGLLLKINYDYV